MSKKSVTVETVQQKAEKMLPKLAYVEETCEEKLRKLMEQLQEKVAYVTYLKDIICQIQYISSREAYLEAFMNRLLTGELIGVNDAYEVMVEKMQEIHTLAEKVSPTLVEQNKGFRQMLKKDGGETNIG